MDKRSTKGKSSRATRDAILQVSSTLNLDIPQDHVDVIAARLEALSEELDKIAPGELSETGPAFVFIP